jgi:hypothetical protein
MTHGQKNIKFMLRRLGQFLPIADIWNYVSVKYCITAVQSAQEFPVRYKLQHNNMQYLRLQYNGMGMSKGHVCHLNCFVCQAFPLLAECDTGAEGFFCYPLQALYSTEEKKKAFSLFSIMHCLE